MSYSLLSIIERGQLETLHGLGWSARTIGQELGRHHSTIAREIKRGQVAEPYKAKAAQAVYHRRRASSVPAGKFSAELATELQEKLEQTWSPEQIAAKRRSEGQPGVCFKTIYRWLYDGKLSVSEAEVLGHNSFYESLGFRKVREQVMFKKYPTAFMN